MTDSYKRKLEKLHRLTVYSRWLFVVVCWLSLGTYSIWALREELQLWRSHFTWAAVRYGLAYNLPASLGLSFCVAITAAVLVWQSRNILHGMPPSEKQRLEKLLDRIDSTGPNHPLWKWIRDE